VSDVIVIAIAIAMIAMPKGSEEFGDLLSSHCAMMSSNLP
jgi:hypothetical protein